MRVLCFALVPWLSSAADDGLALTPPRGWRSWNQFNGAVTSEDIVRAIHGLTDRSRLVDGVPTSLADLGYADVGIDDGWMQCGHYGPYQYRYHDASGAPVVAPKFPSLLNLTRLAGSVGLTMSWYANACGCVAPGACCSDHCESVECFLQDVNATLAYGFSGLKIDGCSAQRDIALWYGLFNQTLRKVPGAKPMLIEQCHDDDGLPSGNAPHRAASGELWSVTTATASPAPRPGPSSPALTPPADGRRRCPFHLYRVSGDAGPWYGSLLTNLNGTRAMADQNLSVPGCWGQPIWKANPGLAADALVCCSHVRVHHHIGTGYADMLEVGVTLTAKVCGASGTEMCPPLTPTEARSHFGAWCVVSSPLVLSFDFANASLLDEHWATVTNRDALAVNAAWAGASGSLFAAAEEVTTYTPCGFKRGSSCQWPSWWSWAKPLPATDARGSVMAVLLMNNGDAPATLRFEFREVFGGRNVSACDVYDVWRRSAATHGRVGGGGFIAQNVQPRDSVFLTLSRCDPVLNGVAGLEV